MKLSANLGFLWQELPLLERVDAAAQAGFPAIELHWPYDTPARDIRARCERHGLALVSLNTAAGDAARGEFGLGALPGREPEFAAGFAQALSYAKESGAAAIHVMAGVVPPAQRAEARQTLIGNLGRAVPLSAAQGVVLLLEAINHHDRPDYLYSRQQEAAAIIEAVGSPHLKLMFDAYHVGMAGGDVLAELAQHWPLIGHIQIAAVPSRAEPDEGSVDYRAVFAALERLGWQGYIGCEYRPRASTQAGLGWRQNLGIPPERAP